MRTTQTIQERAAHDVGVYPQDIGTSDVTGDWFPMKGFGRVAAKAISAQAANGSQFTVQLRQASDGAGTGAADLGSAVSVTAGSADEVLEAIAEVAASDLSEGSTHVAVQLSSDESGLVGTATLIRADGSYRP